MKSLARGQRQAEDVWVLRGKHMILVFSWMVDNKYNIKWSYYLNYTTICQVMVEEVCSLFSTVLLLKSEPHLCLFPCLFPFCNSLPLATVPQGQMLNPPFHLHSLGLFLSPYLIVLSELPPLFLPFLHCPIFNSPFSAENFQLIYRTQPFRAQARSMKRTSVFDSWYLFESLMCRRRRAQTVMTCSRVTQLCVG